MAKFFGKIFKKTALARLMFFIVSDILLLLLACWLAFLLRFDGKIPQEHFDSLKFLLIIVPFFLIPPLYFRKIYRLNWTYISLRDLISLFEGLTFGFAILMVFILLFWNPQPFGQIQSLIGFPRSVIFVDYFLSFLFLGGLRISKRIYLQLSSRSLASGKNLLIIGAGDAGEQILRNILSEREKSIYRPMGFIDNIPQKRGTLIHGLPVLGNLDEMGDIIRKYSIEEIIIALPSANSKLIREAVRQSQKAGLKDIRVLPPFSELISKRITLADLREVRVDDLLGREPVTLDTGDLEAFIRGKRILITGAAGSIGSELCRQIAKFEPFQILALDQDETAIFWLNEEFKEKFPQIKFQTIICDICDKNKFERMFKKFHPEVIFHSAAYKHVPLMEEHPDEGIKNNILGTKIVAELSLKYGIEKVVLISTDKAVKPTSVMGATKKIAEMMFGLFNGGGKTDFISVRFGNVLDSRGSVVPIFKEQIKKGGPIKITHEEMERFFMSPSEAVLLVMQAAAIGRGGMTYVLDMGKPIKIVDLARELIRLSGLEPDKDIQILFTRPRSGEKLSEELFDEKEKTEPTKHKKIFETKTKVNIPKEDFLNKVDKLIRMAENEESEENLKKALWEIIK